VFVFFVAVCIAHRVGGLFRQSLAWCSVSGDGLSPEVDRLLLRDQNIRAHFALVVFCPFGAFFNSSSLVFSWLMRFFARWLEVGSFP
jgi:hypothetical protein